MDQFISGDYKNLMKSIMKWEETRKSGIIKFAKSLDMERLKKKSGNHNINRLRELGI